jgi:hypothetical protein
VLLAPYTFGALIVACRDVDTIKVHVDRGEGQWSHNRVYRLPGCNGAELATVAGAWCADELEREMYPGRYVLISSLKPGKDIEPDKYGGRWVARVATEGGDLTGLLITAGLAAPWNGRGKKPVPPWPVPAGTPRLADLIPRPEVARA